MWPVYAMINELPISDRKLFFGIWISAKKPVMWSFLQPMYEELSMLEERVKFDD